MKVRVTMLVAGALSLWVGAGAALAQKCVSNIPDSTPDSRYTVNADGTVVDNQTGLMWTSCAVGQTWDSKGPSCTGTASALTWQEALLKVQSLDQGAGYAGYKDWRLPNFRELTSLVQFSCHDPAINEQIFPNTPSEAFWTSSPVGGISGLEWSVQFTTGQAGYLGYSNAQPIRLVRAGAYSYPHP